MVVVNKDKLYIYDSRSLKKRKGPIPVSKYYPDGLKHVDASYTLPNGNSVYLQGKRFVEYNNVVVKLLFFLKYYRISNNIYVILC